MRVIINNSTCVNIVSRHRTRMIKVARTNSWAIDSTRTISRNRVVGIAMIVRTRSRSRHMCCTQSTTRRNTHTRLNRRSRVLNRMIRTLVIIGHTLGDRVNNMLSVSVRCHIINSCRIDRYVCYYWWYS